MAGQPALRLRTCSRDTAAVPLCGQGEIIRSPSQNELVRVASQGKAGLTTDTATAVVEDLQRAQSHAANTNRTEKYTVSSSRYDLLIPV